MRGVGKSRGPMCIIMINICIVRTVLLFLVVPRYYDIRSVAAVYPITWAMTALCMTIYYILYHRTVLKKERL